MFEEIAFLKDAIEDISLIFGGRLFQRRTQEGRKLL
jgi:hypothetical protein